MRIMQTVLKAATLVGAAGFAIAAANRYHLGRVFATQPVPAGEVSMAVHYFQGAAHYLAASIVLLLVFIGFAVMAKRKAISAEQRANLP